MKTLSDGTYYQTLAPTALSPVILAVSWPSSQAGSAPLAMTSSLRRQRLHMTS
jgi:hypothetical protein